MWHKVFPFCLILILSQTLAEWKTERARYNNTFQNGVDCFSGPLFWTTCGDTNDPSRNILASGPPFPMVRPKDFFAICIFTNLSQVTFDIVAPNMFIITRLMARHWNIILCLLIVKVASATLDP